MVVTATQMMACQHVAQEPRPGRLAMIKLCSASHRLTRTTAPFDSVSEQSASALVPLREAIDRRTPVLHPSRPDMLKIAKVKDALFRHTPQLAQSFEACFRFLTSKVVSDLGKLLLIGGAFFAEKSRSLKTPGTWSQFTLTFNDLRLD